MWYLIALLLFIFFLDIHFFDTQKVIIYVILFFVAMIGRLFYEFINSFLELNPIAFLIVLPVVCFFALTT